MNDFLSRLQGDDNREVSPPVSVLKDLEARFSNPINIEWAIREDHYEAVFYSNSTEHIASYSFNGRIINYRVNITPPRLPGKLEKNIGPHLEIMNVVKIVSGSGVVSYEIITRDTDLHRYLVNIDSEGQIISSRSL